MAVMAAPAGLAVSVPEMLRMALTVLAVMAAMRVSAVMAAMALRAPMVPWLVMMATQAA